MEQQDDPHRTVERAVITITAGASPIDEGESASFTPTSDRAPTAALSITLSVSETEAMIDSTAPTQATIASGTKTTTLSVATEDDQQTESDSVVTAQLVAGTGYRLGSPNSADVTVEDDDAQIAALQLMASASPTSCETGEQVTVEWTVSGGSGSYTVTVNGVTQSGFSTKVTCQATAGTQTVTVKATDDADSKLTITKTLKLTVTKPPSTVEAQLQARRMSDNRFEIGLRLADGTDVSIKHRFADPTSMADGDWQHSEVLTTEINDRTYT